MSELENLIQQKKIIEQKIKDLKSNSLISSSMCRFEKKDPEKYEYPWQVAALMKQKHKEHETAEEARAAGRNYFERKIIAEYDVNRWQVFIRENSKQEALEKIDAIINSLEAIRKEAMKGD